MSEYRLADDSGARDHVPAADPARLVQVVRDSLPRAWHQVSDVTRRYAVLSLDCALPRHADRPMPTRESPRCVQGTRRIYPPVEKSGTPWSTAVLRRHRIGVIRPVFFQFSNFAGNHD